jgi:hypothetical protein
LNVGKKEPCWDLLKAPKPWPVELVDETAPFPAMDTVEDGLVITIPLCPNKGADDDAGLALDLAENREPDVGVVKDRDVVSVANPIMSRALLLPGSLVLPGRGGGGIAGSTEDRGPPNILVPLT